jgi:hypothetical protein
MVGLAIADLATGNTNHSVLPETISDHLDQQTDLVLAGLGAGALWVAHSQL